MLKDIIEVRSLGGHKVYLRFEDGIEGEMDLGDVIDFTGIFAPLQNEAEFAKIELHAELGTVVWSNGADLDPDVLYSALAGQPIDITALAALEP